MPLVRFEVRNEYGLGSEGLYKEANSEEPKEILDGVAVAGLVGILRQLGDLAEFAAEVFHGLQEQVVATASKSHKMLVRVQNIEAALPALEKAVMSQKSHIHFAYTAGCEWHPKIRMKHKHFIHSDLPHFLLDSYEECHDPPRLQLLDRFDIGGPGACLRRYSDPSFFRKSISRSESAKAEKVHRRKRVHKCKKRSSRWRNGELSHVVLTSQSILRIQFDSPHSYGQTSTAETISTVQMKSKSEEGDISPSLDSRTKTVEEEQQEDDNHDISPKSTLDTQVHTAIDDNTALESFQELSSSSVTWEEKTEIVEESKTYPSDTTEMKEIASELLQGDIISVASELFQESTDLSKVSANIPDLDSLSEVDEFDDARNILESETETDYECQTKRHLEDPAEVCESEESLPETNPVNVWTNGGLLGLQPSKPPVNIEVETEKIPEIVVSEVHRSYPLIENVTKTTCHEESFPLPLPLPPSPPLEHMRISFHPMNNFETTKLSLKFPGGYRFRESIKDVIFPSFQLLPQPGELQSIGSESENDTFCRSSPYSNDLTESSSELWESDDSVEEDGSNDREMYDVLRRVSSVGSSVSSDGVKKFCGNAVFDLPSFDSVSSLDHRITELTVSPPPPPPPAPLPPVEKSRNDMRLDEREDLLHQIRSKSFNLRRTVPEVRQTLPETPTTNNNVAAIIEKAHAIRQAYVGSDGGDESWSDT